MAALDALDLGDGVGHRGLHPDAEHVELEQAEVLDVLLVELAHRVAQGAALHRGAVEQGAVGEQHPARVHRDVAGQPVEALHQPEEQVEAAPLPGRGLPGQAGRPQLGQVAQRHPGVAGPHVRERLGDGVDLAHRHAERGPDVADRVAHLVGVHHRDRRAPLPAVALQDRVVDLQPARGLHVDVDVGQRAPQRGQEALHQQAVTDRVDPGDAEQVVDQAAGAGAPGGAADAELADHLGDVADGQEVGGVAERGGWSRARRRAASRSAGAARRRSGARCPPRTGRAAPRPRVPPAPTRGRDHGGARPRTPGSGPPRGRGRRGGRARTGRRPCGCAASSARRHCRSRRSGRSPRPPRASACRTSRTPRRCAGRGGAGPSAPAAGWRRGRRSWGRRGGRRSGPRC